MREDEWEAGLGMIGHGEGGRAPALNSMAAFAAPTVGSLCELALVRIGFVAVSTSVVRNWRFEIGGLVTSHTGHANMLPLQREASF